MRPMTLRLMQGDGKRDAASAGAAATSVAGERRAVGLATREHRL
jgi:hypothetical protein